MAPPQTAIKVTETPIDGVLLLRPKVFADERGFFLESYNQRNMVEAGIPHSFVQDNHSFSTKGVLRGMHYQVGCPQGKLMRAITGEVFDVVVDLRKSSPTFGRWHGVVLSGKNQQMLWVPPGLAHGFLVRSDTAHFVYKATDYYAPELERTLAWNDPSVGIDWMVAGNAVIISEKDQRGKKLQEAETFE